MLGNIVKDENTLLKEALNDDTFIVDVRTPEEFAEGSAKGAVNIPLDQVLQRLNEFENKENIIVFCRSGNRSDKVKAELKQNGFEKVLNAGTWQIMDDLVKEKK